MIHVFNNRFKFLLFHYDGLAFKIKDINYSEPFILNKLFFSSHSSIIRKTLFIDWGRWNGTRCNRNWIGRKKWRNGNGVFLGVKWYKKGGRYSSYVIQLFNGLNYLDQMFECKCSHMLFRQRLFAWHYQRILFVPVR